jgi:predicted nucleic acid-binding protein
MPKSLVVIDANLAIYSVLNTPQSIQAAEAQAYFQRQQASLFAPLLWWFEVTSVIHRYFFDKLITASVAIEALDILFSDLAVEPVENLYRSAFDWASRLQQKAAYDGFYLAAAEHLGAELWTADQALGKRARQLGVSWVRWMGEAAAVA